MNMKNVSIKTKSLGTILATLLCISTGFGASPGDLDGVWATGEDNSQVEVFEKEGKVFGKLISSDNPKAKVGTEILQNFQEVGGVWKGSIYAAKRDKLMDASIKPSADSLEIKASSGMVSKMLVWTRVQP